MNLEKISGFSITIVIMAAMAGNLDRMNYWVQVVTAKILWESRTSVWGSPRYWPSDNRRQRQSTR